MKKTILLLVLAFATILCAQSVMSATTNIYTNANGAYTAWSSYGCASDYLCLQDSDTTDYLYSNSSAAKDSSEFDDLSLAYDTQINSLKVYYYAKWNSPTQKYFKPLFVAIPGTLHYGTLMNTTANYSYYTQTDTTNPNTGVAWTVYDINNLEQGIYVWPTNGGAYVAYMYGAVNYTNTSTGYPDLTISSIDFEEFYPLENCTYYNATNTTNCTYSEDLFVSINTTVYNQGTNIAGKSNLELNGLSTTNWLISKINAGSSSVYSKYYQCTSAHTFTATADYYNVLYESDETNNVDSTYIDCVI